MLGQESTHRFNSWASCFCSWHERLTNRTEVLQGMLCRTMVQHLPWSQQCQTVKQFEYGITGLMDGKYDGSPSSWEPETETKHLLSTPHFEFQEGNPQVSKSKTNIWQLLRVLTQKNLLSLLCHCVRCCLQAFQDSTNHYRRPSLQSR